MSFVLNAIYLSLLVIGSPWFLWRYLRWGKNRRGWGQKLFGLVPIRNNNRPCIWFHAVSVGEVNLLAQMLRELDSERPDLEIVISTTTETGFDLARSKYPDLTVFFFPFDFSWAIKNSLKRIKPSLVVLSELELWPNFIRIADRFPAIGGSDTNAEQGIPIVVVNGRLSEPSYRGYRRLGFVMRGAFERLHLVMAQNKTYAERFKALGCHSDQVLVTGSVKFDGLQTDRQNPKTQRLARLAGFQPNDFVFVAGSTQFEEDILAAKTFQKLVNRFPQLRLVLVPRHPERVPQLVRALDQLGVATRRRSQLTATDAAPSTDQHRVLIVDVIGELGAWWGVADVAYVGGSMGSRGGQNMIEPAAYGTPVAFGPHTENFQEVVDQLLEAAAASVVHDLNELTEYVERSLLEPAWASEMGAKAKAVVLQHNGASQRTVENLCEILATPLQKRQRSAA